MNNAAIAEFLGESHTGDTISLIRCPREPSSFQFKRNVPRRGRHSIMFMFHARGTGMNTNDVHACGSCEVVSTYEYRSPAVAVAVEEVDTTLEPE